MIFSTTIFLFVFLPFFLAGYYLLPFKLRSAWIVLGSWIFYGWWRIDFLGLMIAVTIWTYIIGRLMDLGKDRPARMKLLVTVGVVLNLGVLAYFKYFNFGVDTLNFFLKSAGFSPVSPWRVILPIGISFYLFQATSYVIDVYRKDVPPAKRYIDLAAYISLFPQLIAGPIIRYKDINRQIESRSHTWEKFSKGAFRFMAGFCKKVLIADTVGTIVNQIFTLTDPTLSESWLGAIAYTVQLYIDFSAYSDMAIGLGLMMGFRFIENFNHPYISRNITEFWRRWHISLSSWLRDYLYISLGGNRRGYARTYVNLMIVMLLGGLWHGAAWTFVLWGGFHGFLLAFERLLKDKQKKFTLPRSLAVARTMLLVIIGWVMFRAGSLAVAGKMYAGMIGLNGVGLRNRVTWQLDGFSLAVLSATFVLMFLMPWIREQLRTSGEHRRKYAVAVQYGVIPLFLLSILKVIADSYSPFLYYQF
ncbi:MAG: MBOAT family O-acyltransferase [Spirochaetia bacterium]